MARALLFIALFVLPAIVTAARPNRNPYQVQGCVYCDACRAGFETSAISYIAGAKVRVECSDRKSMQLVYSKEATTDSTGTYKIPVNEDHQDQYCDVVLVSSPQADCKMVTPGRERARVILTDSNGMSSRVRYANNLGFMKDKAMSSCTQILKQYQEEEEDD